MHPTIRTILAAQGGVASTSQLEAAGVSRFEVRRLAQRGDLVRLRRGVVVDTTVWRAAASWDKHLIRSRGLMLGPAGAADSPVALSHQSALALHGIALYGVDDRVHVVRTDGRRGQTDAFIQCHAPVAPELTQRVILADGVDIEPVRAVRPAVALLQVAATFGVEAGLVSADCAVRRKVVTREDLTGALAGRRLGNGASNARMVVEELDPEAESPGESRCRWIFHVLGLPRPVSQAVIRDEMGAFVARVDFLFADERTIVEFDGRVKYTDSRTLFAEKEREDALRALGYSVVRITWKELADPRWVLLKVRRGFRAAANLRP